MRLAEQGGDVPARVRTHQPIGSAVIETDSLQPVEIAQQLLPFWRAINDQRQDHLAKIRPPVLGIAMLAERLAALAIEREARRIHEHGGKIGEEITPLVEQLLLDRVLDATRCESVLALFLHLLAEPGHGAVEMMQIQSLGA